MQYTPSQNLFLYLTDDKANVLHLHIQLSLWNNKTKLYPSPAELSNLDTT